MSIGSPIDILKNKKEDGKINCTNINFSHDEFYSNGPRKDQRSSH